MRNSNTVVVYNKGRLQPRAFITKGVYNKGRLKQRIIPFVSELSNNCTIVRVADKLVRAMLYATLA